MIQNVGHPDQKADSKDPTGAEKIGRPTKGLTGAVVRDLVVFGLFALYLWQVVGLHLIFHGAGLITNFPSFYTTWACFENTCPHQVGPSNTWRPSCHSCSTIHGSGLW